MKIEDFNPVRDVSEYDLALNGRTREFERTSRNKELDFAIRWLTLAISLWSLVQAPAELASAASNAAFLALIFAKVVWIALSAASLLRVKYTCLFFAFLCSVSLAAVVPALALEYRQSTEFFVLSLVDCNLKAGFLICIGIRYFRDDGA